MTLMKFLIRCVGAYGKLVIEYNSIQKFKKRGDGCGDGEVEGEKYKEFVKQVKVFYDSGTYKSWAAAFEQGKCQGCQVDTGKLIVEFFGVAENLFKKAGVL